jgi:hypothetical protein
MAMIHVNRSGATLGVFEEEKVREGLRSGEFIGTDLGWMEGMAAWRPLSELESFRTPPPPPPVQAAAAVPQPAVAVTSGSKPERTGLPWENREGRTLINALIDTLMMVFTRPADAFSIMKREGGLGEPLSYTVILGSVGAVVALGFSLIMQSVGIMSGRQTGIESLFGFGLGSIFLVLFIPVFLAVGTFIGAAIAHVCLMVVGGANQSFETTFRVLCYASGSANALQLVPICGGFLAGLAGLVLNCMGLARAHETDTWRAVVAILLPVVLCCGGLGVLFAVIIGSMSGTNWH